MRIAPRNLALAVGLLSCWALGCSSDETTTGATSSTGSSTTTSTGQGGSGNTGTGASTSSSSSSTAASTGSAGEGGTGGTGGTGGSGGNPPQCEASTHTCAPETPVDWTGPVALYTGPGDMAPPACVGNYATNAGEYDAGLDPGVASCGCTCDAAQGILCTASVNLCFTDSACGNPCFAGANNQLVPPLVCTPIGNGSLDNVNVGDPAPTTMGSCAAQTNNTLPMPTWATAAKACGGATTTPTGCMSGEICAPLALAPFDQMCVVHTGDVACPNGFYADKHVFFEGFTDTRDCSACGCGAADSKCGGSVDFTSQSCSILISTVSAPGCDTKNFGGTPNGAIYGPTPSGTCPPTGGQLSGTATETSPVTFCCAL